MTDSGWLPHDLAGNCCEECGRPKLNRLLFDGLGVQNCATCTEVATRHRCTRRPDIETLAIGATWECPDCGSVYGVSSHKAYCPDCCADCGHVIQESRWDLVLKGDRIDTAPRYEPKVFTPLRNVFKGDRIPGKPFPGLPY